MTDQPISDADLLRSIANAMGWGHKPREEWAGIPDAIKERSIRLFDAEARVLRLEAVIRKERSSGAG